MELLKQRRSQIPGKIYDGVQKFMTLIVVFLSSRNVALKWWITKDKNQQEISKISRMSPQRCIFKDESSKDIALQCRKCHRAVHYQCSQLPAHQIQLCLSFKERRYQCPNCIKVSQQVLDELELSRRDTIEINNKTNKKVNNTNNNNTEKNNVNTKNENKHSNKHKIRNANYNNNNNSNDKNNNNNNNKQSNELNINGTIEERLMKLESKFNILIETSDIKK